MDKATIGGLVMACGALIFSILMAPGSSMSMFIDYPSMAVVIVGGAAAAMMSLPMATFMAFPKVTMKVFKPNVPPLAPVIKQLVEFAEIARRDGILALESKTAEIKDPFILLGIQMAVDGTDGELIESIMRTEMMAVSSRHKAGKAIFDSYGRYAPAYGMIGTLLGLIIMLGNMDDPAAIGPGMAVALITTLYGAMVSNMMCLPFADKLAIYSKRELEVREVIVRGILAIQEGDNPRVLEQKLQTMLPMNQRTKEEKAA